jgi:hypothetical protein
MTQDQEDSKVYLKITEPPDGFKASQTLYGDPYIERCFEVLSPPPPTATPAPTTSWMDRYLRYTTRKIDGSSHTLVQGFWVAANAVGSAINLRLARKSR